MPGNSGVCQALQLFLELHVLVLENRYRTVKALVTLPMLSESWCGLVHDMDIFRMSSTDKSVRGNNAASPFFETTASEHRRLESSPSPAVSDPGWFAFQL